MTSGDEGDGRPVEPGERRSATPISAPGNGARPFGGPAAHVAGDAGGRRMWVERVVVVLAWAMVAVLTGVFALRQVDLPFVAPGPFVLALFPWLMATSSVPLVVAVVVRRRSLLAASLVLVVASLAVVVPQIGRGPQPVPAGADVVRVATANLFSGNGAVDDIVALLVGIDADVIALQELTPTQWAAISSSELGQTHPWSVVEPRADSEGIGLLSRLPAADLAIVDLDPHPAAVARVTTPGGVLDVVNVHPPAPSPRTVAVWRAELRAVADLVDGLDRPLVLGDLNATVDHPPMRAVMAAGGLSDAHRQAGRGWGGTWPSRERQIWDRRWPWPVLIRIDHVLVPRGVEAVDVRTMPIRGSDHRLVLADLVVSPVERSGEA